MEYVTIYDDRMRLAAVLDNADAVGYTLVHNDLWTATFSLPNSDPKNGYCQPGAMVRIPDGQRKTGLYRVNGIPDATATGMGTMTTYNAEHVLATLLDDVIYGTLDIQDKPPAEAIAELLSMQTVQRWVLGVCDYTEPVTAVLSYETLLSALQKICGQLPDDYTWDFDTNCLPWVLNIRHADTLDGCGMHYARNLVEIKKTVDATQIVTRLYLIGGAGSNGDLVRVGEINDGLDYIEANTVTNWGVRAAIYSNSEITTPEALLQRGRQVLETYKAPYYTYQATALDLYRVTGQPWDDYMPGKLVRVMDDEHGVHFSARIISVEKKDVFGDPGGITITVANAPRDQLNTVTALATKVSSLDTGMSSAASEIVKTEKQIDNLSGRVTQAETTLSVQAEGMTVLSARTTTLEDEQQKISAQLNVNNDSIGTLVTKTNALEGRITGAESSIEQYEDQINQRVEEFEGRVVTAETAIEQTAKDLSLCVKKDDDISSMIELSGDGVTISGGVITLTGYVKTENLEAEVLSAVDGIFTEGLISAANISVTDLVAASVSATSTSTYSLTIAGSTCTTHTLTIGEKTCTFFAPADATFELSDMPGYDDALAAARTEGASSVTLTGLGWRGGEYLVRPSNGKPDFVVELPNDFKVTDTYTFTDHKTTINFATADDILLKSKEVDATSEYTAGVEAGYANATPTEVSRVATYDSATNAYQVTVVVTSADGSTKDFALVDIDATAAYDAGYAAAKAATTVEGGLKPITNVAPNTMYASGWARALVSGEQAAYTTFSVSTTFPGLGQG